jgi:hypothetical protein
MMQMIILGEQMKIQSILEVGAFIMKQNHATDFTGCLFQETEFTTNKLHLYFV